tara:strand:- start:1768 stop:3252 length:1485 start_codon:yes stop_codon:yes gene_type:complete
MLKPVMFHVHANYTFVEGIYDASVVDEATRFRKSGYRHATAYKNRVWDGYTRLFSKAKNAFPTGLLDRVIKHYKKHYPNFLYIVTDHRDFLPPKSVPKVQDVPLEGVTLRQHQVKAGNAMLRKKHGVLWAATNSGKTEVAIATIKALDSPTLFLVKGKDLVLQTYERFKKRLGGEEVGIVMSTKWDVRKFTVASADTLARRFNPTKVTPKALEAKRKVEDLLTSVKVVVIDECHTLASDGLFSIVRYCTAPYRFGLSGTPFKRGDKQDLKLIALTGEVCYKVTNKEMISDGVSVPTHITFVDIDKPTLPVGIDYPTAYEDGIVNNIYRNKIISDAALKYCAAGKQVLIIVKKIDHGHLLSDLLTASGAFIPHTFIHGSVETEVRTEALENFKNGITKVLIASSILDQGVDIPNIDVLIFASGGNSYIRAIQRVGRGLRMHHTKDKLVVVDFSDRTNKYLAKHSVERIKTYTKEKCFTIDIVDTVEELVGVHHGA